MPIDIIKKVHEIRELYAADLAQDTFNALILGQIGAGKTYLLSTARKPILIHSFDPGGTKTLRKEIQEGSVLPVTTYEKENSKEPTAFATWERDFNELLKSDGFFEQFGTFVIDSFTTWFDALYNQLVKVKGRTEILQIQDWQVLGNTIRDYVKLITSLPCDCIFTGHIVSTTDELTGRSISSIKAPPSLQVNLPILFDEIYVLEAKQTAQGIDRKLITCNNGIYQARTRIGRDKFAIREEANIKALLRKAGLSAEDKPAI